MRPTKSTPQTPFKSKPAELLRAAQEYADLFNVNPLDEIDRLIADACVDPFWDDRTNLLALLADDAEDLGLVLSGERDEDYVVVRYVGEWVVDCASVDWEALEDQAFDPVPDER